MTSEPYTDEGARKKRLGQFFTGRTVGRLLAALAHAESADRVIDPMVGSGDLLAACLEIGAQPTTMVGIDIDPLALGKAEQALNGRPGVELILGDAFSARLPAAEFDLVITNPPYIRYQQRANLHDLSLPSHLAARTGLLNSIHERVIKDSKFREHLLYAAKQYPGTADIAVPAWILSASLVREGGVLAAVVPAAWLSRRYARAVRQLLDLAFDLEFVVEDGDASWFEDALVRTHLVVARRRTASTLGRRNISVRARATRALAATGALTGGLASEAALVRKLESVESMRAVHVATGLTAHIERDLGVSAAENEGWVPARVVERLGAAREDIAIRTLESYGWRVGQGLRTGANDFFYVTRDESGLVNVAERWRWNPLYIPSDCLIPAIRRQDELGQVFEVRDTSSLKSQILYLRGWATAKDRERLSPRLSAKILPGPVAEWIHHVSQTNFSATSGRRFPELAAVSPNERFDEAGRPTSFWYQLPELTRRHQPALFLPRVCASRPLAYANTAKVVVDANFATLWPDSDNSLPAPVILALLHSSWAWANLETRCTVLGGGALKVEATDLRNLALPELEGVQVERLLALGRALMRGPSSKIGAEIDAVVLANCGDAARRDWSAELDQLAREAMRQRTER